MNYKKRIYCVLMLTCVSALSYAQEGFHKIGAGVEIAMPMGDFSDGFSVGFGATGKVFYGISVDADITGTVGYLHFGMKSSEYVSGHVSMIPVQFGYRHNFGGFYAEPQLGLMFVSSKVTFQGMGGIFGNASGSASETKFSLGIGGGYEFGDWDFGLRYQIVEKANFLGMRVGYSFSL